MTKRYETLDEYLDDLDIIKERSRRDSGHDGQGGHRVFRQGENGGRETLGTKAGHQKAQE